MSNKNRVSISQEQAILGLTAVLVVVMSIILPTFFEVGNILALARNVSILGILGLGMGIVVIGKGLDLSLIVSMCLGPAIAINLTNAGMPLYAGLAIGFLFILFVGVLNGFIISFIEIPALFTTLATGFLLYGLVRLLFLEGFITYVKPELKSLLFLGQGAVFGIPMPILVFVLSAALVHFLLSSTSIGIFIYSHGDNSESASFTGIAIRPLSILEYVFSAAIAFLAGLVSAATTASVNTQIINSTLIFDVILIVVVGGISLAGGRGSVWSVIAGTLLIGTLLNGMTLMNLDGTIQNIIKGVVLLAAILIDNKIHPKDEETARQGD